MTPKTTKPYEGKYQVGNPRGIPKGRHILSNKDRSKKWYEGDEYDGEVSDWLIKGKFLVPLKRREVADVEA